MTAISPRSLSVQGPRRRRWPNLLGLALPLGAISLWFVLSAMRVLSPQVLPGPDVVAVDLWKLALSGKLAGHILTTLWRVALGFAFGACAATLLGALTGYSLRARALLDPSLQALKAVPSLAWVPLFILWFGIFEASKVTLIAVGVFFPVYVNLASGLRNVDRKLVEVGLVNNLGTLRLITRILIPAALPAWFAGLRTGLAVGWMFVIAAELMGASQGLGFLMIDGEMTGKPSIILGSLMLFAVLGKATDALIVEGERRWLYWSDDFSALQRRDAP